MYYIISEDGSRIIDQASTMSDEVIQGYADEFKCAVYAIRGEHSGYSAEPQKDGDV